MAGLARFRELLYRDINTQDQAAAIILE